MDALSHSVCAYARTCRDSYRVQRRNGRYTPYIRMGDHCITCNSQRSVRPLYPISPKRAVVKAVNTKANDAWKITSVLLLRKLHAGYQNCQLFHQLYITGRTASAKDIPLTKRFWELLYVIIYKSRTGFPKKKRIPPNVCTGKVKQSHSRPEQAQTVPGS